MKERFEEEVKPAIELKKCPLHDTYPVVLKFRTTAFGNKIPLEIFTTECQKCVEAYERFVDEEKAVPKIISRLGNTCLSDKLEHSNKMWNAGVEICTSEEIMNASVKGWI